MRGKSENGGKKARPQDQARVFSRSDLVKALGLSDAEIAERKRFLDLCDATSKRLQQLKGPIETGQHRFIDSLYRHLSSFAGPARLIADTAVQRRLRAGMRRYFTGLTAGRYDQPYVEERVWVGAVHQRIGLDLKWYFGAYRIFLSEMIRLILTEERSGADAIEDLDALLKIVFFDAGLAIGTYLLMENARQRAAERRRRFGHGLRPRGGDDPLLDEFGHSDGITGEVRKLLMANLGRPTGLDRIAAQLNMSPRTLRRQLQNAGTTFRLIADELRMQIAIKYLRETSMTNEDIAGSLGFSDAANFRRSFRRWTNATPSEFRDRAKMAD